MFIKSYKLRVYVRDLFSENFHRDMQLFDIECSLDFVEQCEALNIVV